MRKESEPCPECMAGLCAFCYTLTEGWEPQFCGCGCEAQRQEELAEFFARVDAVNGDPIPEVARG